VTQQNPTNLLPPLSSDEYAALKANISERGVLVPVLFDEDRGIIDGHHRVQIAEELGLDYPEETLVGLGEDDRVELSLTLNASRRNLTRDEKVPLAIGLRERGWTLERIARTLGVSTKTAQRWTSELSNDNSEVITNERGQVRPAKYKPRAEPTYPEVAQFGVPAPEREKISAALDAMPKLDREEARAKIKGERGSYERKNTMAVLAGHPPMSPPDAPRDIAGDAVIEALAALEAADDAVREAREYELTQEQEAVIAAAITKLSEVE